MLQRKSSQDKQSTILSHLISSHQIQPFITTGGDRAIATEVTWTNICSGCCGYQHLLLQKHQPATCDRHIFQYWSDNANLQLENIWCASTIFYVSSNSRDIRLCVRFEGFKILHHHHTLQGSWRTGEILVRINGSRPNSIFNVRLDATHKIRNRKCINPSKDLAGVYSFTLYNHRGSGLSLVSRQIPVRFNFPWKRGRALVNYATSFTLPRNWAGCYNRGLCGGGSRILRCEECQTCGSNSLSPEMWSSVTMASKEWKGGAIVCISCRSLSFLDAWSRLKYSTL